MLISHPIFRLSVWRSESVLGSRVAVYQSRARSSLGVVGLPLNLNPFRIDLQLSTLNFKEIKITLKKNTKNQVSDRLTPKFHSLHEVSNG